MADSVSKKEQDFNELNPIFNSLSNAMALFEMEKRVELQRICGSLKNISEKIEVIDFDYKKEIFEKKRRFNVFSCLTRHHLEELHSKFISYLLNPLETHDCGTLFLSEFINVLKEDSSIKDIIESVNPDFNTASVTPELHIGYSSDSDIYGRIDIFIKTNKLNIAIENKIRAGEQPEQIERYAKYCKQLGRKSIVLFLSPFGRESEQSGNEEYHIISYKQTIIKWLENSLFKANDFPSVCFGISSYICLLNEKILFITPKKIIMELKKMILEENNISILKYIKEIKDTLNEISQDTRMEFFRKTLSLLNKKYNYFKVVHKITIEKTLSEILDYEESGFVLYDPAYIYEINENEKIFFCIQHNLESLYFGLFGIKFNSDKKLTGFAVEDTFVAKDLDKLLQSKNEYKLESPEDSWYLWKYFYPLNKDIGLLSDEFTYDLSTKMDEISDQFVSEIDNYLLAWKETIKELQNK